MGGGATSNMFCLPWSHCFKLAKGFDRSACPVNSVTADFALPPPLQTSRGKVSSSRRVKTPCDKGRGEGDRTESKNRRRGIDLLSWLWLLGVLLNS